MATQGVWSADLAQESSTLREILAVRNVLQSFAPKLAGLCVKWHKDYQNVACIIGVISELMASDGLRSVGGLQVASEWLMQTPLGLFVLASEWLTSILLALFVLCYSQWVAYKDFTGIICYS